MTPFAQLGLQEDLLKAIDQLGFQTPTPVQELVIPHALQSETDLIALAQTGTGKTAAFGLPLLQNLDAGYLGVQALIMCPTRELCVQVANDITNFAKFSRLVKVTAVYGGANIVTQIRQIKAGTQIVVATPGRLVDLIKRNAIDLESVSRVVLDEADEMLNMGFKDDLDFILGAASERESVWLFSATMSDEVRSIARNYMENPVELSVGRKNQTNENIEHVYYVCRPHDRYAALKRVVDFYPGIFGLVFCRTKAETKEIAEQMMKDGYNADTLHGDLSQNDRDRVMARFREGNLQLLGATDVAARGIDVSDITHVINYGLPDDLEVYTHRSGRTGRAGKTGIAISIITNRMEDRIRHLERFTKAKFERKDIPTGVEVCERQLLHIVQTIHDTEVQSDLIAPFLPKIYEALRDLSKEELIKRFASVEFNRFLSYYKGSSDLNIYKNKSQSFDRPAGPPLSGPRDRSTERFHRLFVNIGELDGVNKKWFLKVMTKDFNVPAAAIGQIDIKYAYMHLDVERAFVEQVKAGLLRLEVNDRKLRVDSASERKSGGKPEGGINPKKGKFKEKHHKKKKHA